LGLKNEDEKAKRSKDDACHGIGLNDMSSECGDEEYGGDHLQDEIGAICDWKNPIMSLDIRYKDMATFWLAMRQYAIKKEFELGIEASTQIKYRGHCRGGDCPWSINARVEAKGCPTIIVCSPTSSWVASLALPILMKKPHMGAKELQTTLQDTHCDRTPLKKQEFVSQDPTGGFSLKRECANTHISIQYHDIQVIK
jgi:hypothetical protein